MELVALVLDAKRHELIFVVTMSPSVLSETEAEWFRLLQWRSAVARSLSRIPDSAKQAAVQPTPQQSPVLKSVLLAEF
jgi:hypothetical protein